MISRSSLELWQAAPELVLAIAVCLVLFFSFSSVFIKRFHFLVFFSLSATIFSLFFVDEGTHYALSGLYVTDFFSRFIKLLCVFFVLLNFIYSQNYIKIKNIFSQDFFLLSLFSLLGQMIILSANNFLVLYLGLELMSLPLYSLCALRGEVGAVSNLFYPSSGEAAIKYFVLGSVSSAIFLYGVSIIYGSIGTLDFSQIPLDISDPSVAYSSVLLGLLFVIAAVAFKLGAVPFHMWVPDVYEGTNPAAVMIIATTPKLVIFGVTFRLLNQVFLDFSLNSTKILIILGFLSVLVGNIMALSQNNFKRILAYSSIAQTAFVLLGLSSGTFPGIGIQEAYSAQAGALFYVITYVFTTVGVLGLVQMLSLNTVEFNNISDFQGLARSKPYQAVFLTVFLLSLAGIPPFMGFYAKLLVLEGLLRSGQPTLAVIVIFLSVVGAFYYLRIIKTMFFDTPAVSASQDELSSNTNKTLIDPHSVPKQLPCTSHFEIRSIPSWLMGAHAISLLLLGLFPNYLFSFCLKAIQNI